MPGHRELRVSPHGSQGWWVRWADEDQPVTVGITRADAIDKARELAIANRAELVIEGIGGEIDERRDYADHPASPPA